MPGPLLVTGGSGFLGGELLRQAPGPPAGGHLPLGRARTAPEAVEWIELDVRDGALCARRSSACGPPP